MFVRQVLSTALCKQQMISKFLLTQWMGRMFGLALETCSGSPWQWKMMDVTRQGCWALLMASSSPVWWYTLAPQFPLLYHQRGTCALPLQRQTRPEGWGQRQGSGSQFLSPLWFTAPSLKHPKNTHRLSASPAWQMCCWGLSQCACKDARVRTLWERAQAHTSSSTTNPALTARPTKASPLLRRCVSTPHNFSQLTWPWVWIHCAAGQHAELVCLSVFHSEKQCQQVKL